MSVIAVFLRRARKFFPFSGLRRGAEKRRRRSINVRNGSFFFAPREDFFSGLGARPQKRRRRSIKWTRKVRVGVADELSRSAGQTSDVEGRLGRPDDFIGRSEDRSHFLLPYLPVGSAEAILGPSPVPCPYSSDEFDKRER